MAQGTKRSPRTGRKTTRSGKGGRGRGKAAPATVGARLDAVLAWCDALWRRAGAALASRRAFFSAAGLIVLLVVGVGGGYWLAQALVGSPGTRAASVSRPPAAATAPKAPPPVPKYGSIDELPDLPRYSEAEGQPRPVYEERPPAVTPVARRASADATWMRNAIAFQDDRSRPLIVIVIDDMGLDRPRSRRVLDLPAPLTVSFLPYARELQDQARAARGRGHELMLHLPMEPMSSVMDPGPNALLTTLADDAIRRRTAAALDSFGGYVAVNNHMGSRFTTWRPGVETALKLMQARGLAWLDSRTHAQSVGGLVADELGMPHVDRHVFLDDVDSTDNVRQQLAETERVARRQGVAIAIGHPHDATISALAEWLPGLRGKGFVQGPISAAIKRRLRLE
ncbi:divergent polysaccharide deacetylase family protein [Vineibacter terrae]|uniref:Divergent polysaccharide deacetylase family protein n=1 Tax=Vineibacter terrae TaxID=2586908 RepID=A0A5C8PPV3_9HYPH|nr:divergent polysaccharide deacetylase family protein [Vineibacter terrae]TXL76764.1 divergent polysaccharide deacetylase family protein [Vineibacter terrae]